MQSLSSRLAVSGIVLVSGWAAGCARPVALGPVTELPVEPRLSQLASMPGDGFDKTLVWASLPAAAAGDEDEIDLEPIRDRSLFDDLPDAPLIEAKPADKALKPCRSVPREALRLYLDGRSAWHARKYADSVALLEQARNADPKAYQVNLLLGRIYLLAGRRDLGRQRLTAATEDTPDNFDARYLLGRAHFEAKEYGPAVEQLTAALSNRAPSDDLGPRAAQAWLYLARSLQENRNYADAVKAYRSFLNAVERGVRPGSGEDLDLFRYGSNPSPVFLWLAKCFTELGKADKALRAAEDAVQVNPADRGPTVELIMMLLTARNNDRAAAVAAHHVEVSRETKVALELLDDTWQRAGRTGDQILEEIRNLHKRLPENGTVTRFLADKLKAAGHEAEAAALLEEVVGVEKNSPEVLVKLAETREQAGDRIDALRILSRGLMASEKADAGTESLAKALADTIAREKDAAGLARKLDTLRTADRDDGLHYAAALLAIEGKRYEDAIRLLARLTEKRPRFAQAYDQLAQVHVRQAAADPVGGAKRLERALGVCLKAVDAGLTGARFHREAGRIEWKLYQLEKEQDNPNAEKRLPRITEHLQDALKADADDAGSRALLVDVLIDQSKVADALREALAAAKLAPDNEEAVIGLIRSLCLNKKNEEAVAAADEFLRKNPKSVNVLRWKAKALALMHEYPTAADVLLKALALAPDAAAKREIRLELAARPDLVKRIPAGMLLMAERWAEAAEQMRALVEEDKKTPKPDDAEKRKEFEADMLFRQIGLIRFLLAAEKVDDAKAVVDELYKNEPKDLDILIERIIVSAKSGDDVATAGAAAEYRKVAPEVNAGLKPNEIELAVADAFATGGRRDLEEKLVRNLIEKDTEKDLQLRYRLASILSSNDKKDYAGAEKVLKEMLEDLKANPDGEVLVLKFLSGVYTLWKKNPEAADALEKAYRLKPDDIGLNNDLGYTWADLGKNLDQAKEMIMKAVEAEPFNAAYRDSLGWILYKVGDFKGAKENLLKATAAHEGSDPVLWEHLGDCLWRLNEKRAAQDAWTKSADLFGKKDKKDPVEEERLRKKLKDAGDGKEPQLAPLGDKRPAVGT